METTSIKECFDRVLEVDMLDSEEKALILFAYKPNGQRISSLQYIEGMLNIESKKIDKKLSDAVMNLTVWHLQNTDQELVDEYVFLKEKQRGTPKNAKPSRNMEIVRLMNTGVSYKTVASMFDLTPSRVYMIVNEWGRKTKR